MALRPRLAASTLAAAIAATKASITAVVQQRDYASNARAAAAAAILAACCWPSGLYFTDGAGGKLNLWPAMRLRGCGIAHVTNDEANLHFIFGAFFGLVGKPQTVPRSELFAIVVLCRFLQHNASVLVYTDSLIVANGCKALRKTGSMSDLWCELWRLAASKNLTLDIRWVKAHGLENLNSLINTRSQT